MFFLSGEPCTASPAEDSLHEPCTVEPIILHLLTTCSNILPNSNQSNPIRTTTSHTMSGSEPIKGGKSYAPAP